MEWKHIVPNEDLIEHATEGHEPDCCECGPKIDVENHLVIHAALDRREVFERQQDTVEECSTSSNTASDAIALLEELVTNGDAGPMQLLAWYQGERDLIQRVIDEGNSTR